MALSWRRRASRLRTASSINSLRWRAGTLTQRAPWAVAAGFGLLHGLGFAGALAEVGLPTAEIPLALFSFNVGIGLGQFAFAGAVLLAAAALRRVPVAWPAVGEGRPGLRNRHDGGFLVPGESRVADVIRRFLPRVQAPHSASHGDSR